MKSVRQKDKRKPAILYCPEACEKDMVYSSLMQNVSSDTLTIYKSAKLVCNSITKFAQEEKETDTTTVSSASDNIPMDLYSLIRWILVGYEE